MIGSNGLLSKNNMRETKINNDNVLEVSGGQVINLCGDNVEQIMAQCLEDNSDLVVAWVTKNKKISPSIEKYQFDRSRVLFISGEEESKWAAFSVLNEECFPVVVIEGGDWSDADLRRIARLSFFGKTRTFLLTKAPLIGKWIHRSIYFGSHSAEKKLNSFMEVAG
ncbi:MAG: hypothetical protein M9962_08515 [Oligoflexia bacterium]|nr:hypothetical protein [Oligoflexia bacterium]